MKKKNISILNTIIKTIISIVLVVFLWWFIIHKLISPVRLTTITEEIIFRIFVVLFNFLCVYILWKIIPYDTKAWINNWRKEDFVKTGSVLSLISTIIKIPLAVFGSWFFVINISMLPFLWIFDETILGYILMFIIFCWILPGDIKHWIKQWNK